MVRFDFSGLMKRVPVGNERERAKMAEFKNILYTTDFSEAAHKALSHALEFVRRFDSRLTILHVRTLFTDDPSNVEFQFLDEEMYEVFLKSSMEKTAKPIRSEINFRTVIERNVSAAAGILDYAQTEGVDLIVIGTHGRSAVGHFFLGSVAEKVVRHAGCPVLTVGRTDGHYIDKPEHGRILAPFDFSEYSIHSVQRAIELAKRFDATVQVLYVLEQEVHPAFLMGWKESISGRINEIRRNARTALMDALGPERLEGVEIHVKIGDDRSDREIVRFCDEHNIDLVVMGTHGLSGIDRALLGSTTERVVRTAPCPVLTFKIDD